MKNSPISEWLADLGSKTPTPGGGAVAALNGAIAAAQLKMVCEYTKDTAINEKTNWLAQQIEQFFSLAEEDSAVFSKVSEAYKINDQGQINSALVEALQPSIKIVNISAELVDFCETNYQAFNPKLKADLIVVLANLKAAIRSAKAMLVTNVEALSDATPAEANEKIATAQNLLQKIDELYRKLDA